MLCFITFYIILNNVAGSILKHNLKRVVKNIDVA